MSIKTYRKRLSNLRKSDISNNTAIKFISDNGVIVELKYSWIELIISLVVELSVLKGNRVSRALVDASIANNSIIAVKKGIKYFGLRDNTQYIINDKYNIIINDDTIDYKETIIKLLKANNIDIKNCYIEYRDKSSTDKNIKSTNKIESSLKDLVNNTENLDNIKPYKLEINNEKFNCYSLVGIAKTLILYLINKDKDFINSKDTNIEIEIKDNKPRIKIGYNREELIEYIKILLNNPYLASNRVVLTYKYI